MDRANRDRQVNIRVTETEYASIKATADEAAQSVAQALISAMHQAAVLAKLKLDYTCSLTLLAGVMSRAEAYPPGSVSRPIRRAVELISITATLAAQDELSARLSAPMPHECGSCVHGKRGWRYLTVPVELLDKRRRRTRCERRDCHVGAPGPAWCRAAGR